MQRPGVEPKTCWLQIQRPNYRLPSRMTVESKSNRSFNHRLRSRQLITYGIRTANCAVEQMLIDEKRDSGVVTAIPLMSNHGSDTSKSNSRCTTTAKLLWVAVEMTAHVKGELLPVVQPCTCSGVKPGELRWWVSSRCTPENLSLLERRLIATHPCYSYLRWSI